jgi:hypothetical protein
MHLHLLAWLGVCCCNLLMTEERALRISIPPRVSWCIFMCSTHTTTHSAAGAADPGESDRASASPTAARTQTSERPLSFLSDISRLCGLAEWRNSHRPGSLAKSPVLGRVSHRVLSAQLKTWSSAKYTLWVRLWNLHCCVTARRIQIARTIKVAAPSGPRERLKRIGIVSCGAFFESITCTLQRTIIGGFGSFEIVFFSISWVVSYRVFCVSI